MANKRLMLVSAAVATIAVIVGIIALRSSGDSESATAAVVESTTTTASTATSTLAEAPATTDAAPVEPATFTADATLLRQEFSPVEPGTYRVDTLGTPFSFTTSEGRFVQPNSAAVFVLSHSANNGPGDRDIVSMRLSALWNPAQPSMHPDEFDGGWPADDFDGWIDNLSDGVTASNREATTLGGLDAVRVDLEADRASCSPDPEFCAILGTNHLNSIKVLQAGVKYRVWVVDQDGEDPLAIVVGILNESSLDWFDTADEILATLAFGDVGPNPISSTPAGTAELPLLGGMRVELLAETVVVQGFPSFGFIPLDDEPADTEFVTNPRDLDGNALETADDLVGVLIDGGTNVTEVDSTLVGGIEARVFEVSGSGRAPLLFRNAEDARGWFAPPLGQLWLLEHPERGLLMINAESFDGDETVLQQVVEYAEQILGSLEFIDIG